MATKKTVNTKVEKSLANSKIKKYGTLKNILLLTLVSIVAVLAINLVTRSGFFASPASINAMNVSTSAGGSKGGRITTGAIRSTTGTQTTGVQSNATLNTNSNTNTNSNLSNNTTANTGTNTNRPARKGNDDDDDKPLPVVKMAITALSTAGNVALNAVTFNPVGVVTSLGQGAVQMNNLVNNNSTGSTSSNDNKPKSKEECLKAGKKLSECAYYPTTAALNGSADNVTLPSGYNSSVNDGNKGGRKDDETGNDNGGGNPNTGKDEYCGGGKSPMKVGKSYPTGAAMPGKPNERACVEILSGCKHGPAKACHTIPENLVVLPNGAGAEYTSGEDTKSDGSNIKTDRKRNCIDNGGAPVPHNDTQVDKEGKTQFCNNGVWDYTAASGDPQQELKKQKDLCDRLNKARNTNVFSYAVVDGKCVSTTNKCKPGCGPNGERLTCTADGKWRVGSCTGTQACVGAGQCEDLPGTTVSNGKKIITLTKAACVASWAVNYPPGVGPLVTAACAAINAGTKETEQVEIPANGSPQTPVQTSSQGNTVLSDAPGVVNLDTVGTVSGCVGGLTITLVPCSIPLLAGPLGIPASTVCRVAACAAGGTAGNKTGDAIYNLTH